ncbi:FAD-dependent oxidoreductase [Rouxiella sp. S1S-2]|uniref:NAD(P)/FAD-dependent oxidoreductase n=1 Tax=Rouxiella sp. S1S-2 TaxID=2653856 RepID=UPI0012648FE4|nr:FAD-dependent oxidoreductase [Rouxiella sp. S1S-2]KAB7897808.1 FAD-dependent oxidoreductase [Rouxiella sp. S1S-2]
MKVAIIGSGISGLSCAWMLSQRQPACEIKVFEANETLGGHTATLDVEISNRSYAIDTGFIVYNQKTYPRFIALLAQLGITGQPTQMSFSVHNPDSRLEYNGHTLNTLFAQRRNFFKPKFWRFLREILRFNALCKQRVQQPGNDESTVSDLLRQNGFSAFFALHYVLPMGAAIWSSSLEDMGKFPLSMFLRFFDNHGLLDVSHRPQWMVVPGGSREYIRRMQQLLPASVQLLTNTPVNSVIRREGSVTIQSTQGSETFDQVIFACHSDQALAMLQAPTDAERQVLCGLPYQSNEVVLHTDINQLPVSRRAWASWNYRLPNGVESALGHTPSAPVHSAIVRQRRASVTYNMNILQGIESENNFCVTLNPITPIDERKILFKTQYRHPVLNLASYQSQQRRGEINGHNRSWFCGAYWHNGFHEDGVRSAEEVVNQLLEQESA